VIRSFKSETLWRIEQLDDVMPKLLDAKKANDARAREQAVAEPVERFGHGDRST
jgi:hypothetical protein